ncbi:Single-stranded DNA-binding protein 3 [Paragonimus heterotremus]|uniref:Single-stranded DNA-binding protein 3 n=1 Tax=Paragonimus heterotremus TaxID=100268 RepID=A0A8J4TM69_9TREM|nr:Single-stranded DNA-binding protein 3 [Paragonimus heterotremus]
MYTKSKGSGVPSDAQSKEKLAVYVYEYLVHIGAQKAATSFLQEIRWDKSISVGEPPGFLHSWWNVFWDLYSAAPERRDTHEHSSEAKAFHDYVGPFILVYVTGYNQGFVNSGYPNGLPHPNHPGMSGPGGVGGPPGGGPGMPPPLGPPGPDPVSMRQRPSCPPLMPGGGLPPGAGPGLQGPSPHHPSMRFHQTGAGGYPGPPVGSSMIPPHANLIPGAGPMHPMHGGPMLPQHHHHPGAMMGHPRPRWMGPSMQQQQQTQPGGPPGPPQPSSGPSVVCSGSAGPNSVSSAGPGSVGPGSCGGGGIVQSPGHPGTPNPHVPPQHLAAPSPINNQGNCQPTEHQSSGGVMPSGHPHHPTPPHYVVGQPPQQQTPPASSSNACLPPEYNTRPSPHLVFGGGGPGSTPDNGMFGAGPGAGDSAMLNGGPGGLPPRSSGMLPPPPPEYSGGMPPSVSSCYQSGPDLKASPLHGGPGSEMIGPSGGPPPLMPSEYPPATGPGGNGNGLNSAGFGGTPESVMMMPPPSHQQASVLQQQQAHMVSVGGSQGQAPPPPPQYVHSGSGGASLQSVCGGSNPSPAGGPGSVQFPVSFFDYSKYSRMRTWHCKFKSIHSTRYHESPMFTQTSWLNWRISSLQASAVA